MKQTRTPKDRVIDISIIRDDPLVTDKKPLNKSPRTMTKVGKNPSSKFECTDDENKPKTKNEDKNKSKDQDKEEVKTRRRKSKAKQSDFKDPGNQKTVKERKARSSGYNRWGRQKDVQLFQTLKQICSEQDISVEDFWNDDVVMSENHQNVLLDLKHKLHWKRRTSAMLKRIQMLAKDQSLSIRQRIMLRRLVAKAKKKQDKPSCRRHRTYVSRKIDYDFRIWSE